MSHTPNPQFAMAPVLNPSHLHTELELKHKKNVVPYLARRIKVSTIPWCFQKDYNDPFYIPDLFSVSLIYIFGPEVSRAMTHVLIES